MKDQTFWKNVLWTDKSNIELLAHKTINVCHEQTAFQEKSLVLTGVNVRVWSSFGSMRHAVIRA